MSNLSAFYDAFGIPEIYSTYISNVRKYFVSEETAEKSMPQNLSDLIEVCYPPITDANYMAFIALLNRLKRNVKSKTVSELKDEVLDILMEYKSVVKIQDFVYNVIMSDVAYD